jgi:hypothetical protein
MPAPSRRACGAVAASVCLVAMPLALVLCASASLALSTPPAPRTFAKESSSRSPWPTLGGIESEGIDDDSDAGADEELPARPGDVAWRTLDRTETSRAASGRPASVRAAPDRVSDESEFDPLAVVDELPAGHEYRDELPGPDAVFDGECENGDCGDAFPDEAAVAPGGLTPPGSGGPGRGGPPPGVGGPRGGGMGGLGGGFGGPPGKSISFDTLWVPGQPLAQQPTDVGLVQHDFAVSWPLWTAGPQGISFTGSVRETDYSTTARLPDGRAFPNRLWNVRVGAGYFRMFANGWMGMVNIGINSASDEPFHSSREVAPFANAFLRVPTNDTDAWLFALVYSPNSQLPFPVPGLAYQMVASEQWQFSLGIPFSATYKPTPRWKFEVSYLPVVLVNARATWQFAESTSLYTGFGTNIDGYFLTDRLERRDQFYSFDHRLMCGVQHNFAGGFSLDVSTGYIFHRFFYEGQGFSDQDKNRLDAGDGVYLMGRLQKRF